MDSRPSRRETLVAGMRIASTAMFMRWAAAALAFAVLPLTAHTQTLPTASESPASPACASSVPLANSPAPSDTPSTRDESSLPVLIVESRGLDVAIVPVGVVVPAIGPASACTTPCALHPPPGPYRLVTWAQTLSRQVRRIDITPGVQIYRVTPARSHRVSAVLFISAGVVGGGMVVAPAGMEAEWLSDPSGGTTLNPGWLCAGSVLLLASTGLLVAAAIHRGRRLAGSSGFSGRAVLRYP